MGTLNRVVSAVVLTIVAASPAFAQAINSPNASYLSSTTLLPIIPPDFDPVTSLTNGTRTATFSSTVEARTVDASWTSWASPPDAETSMPRLVFAEGATFLSVGLNQSVNTFGLEAEPNVFGTFMFTANFYNGATLVGTVARTIAGEAGSRLFAYHSTTGINRVDLSVEADADGFGLAQFRYGIDAVSVVPEPSTYAMMAAALAGLAVVARRRRTA